jgi:putative phosphoesterase
LAVCADIHDNIWVLARALPAMASAAHLLFCGDFCAPFTLVQLAEGFPGPIHVVWGNNDGDRDLLTTQARRFSHVHLHGNRAEFTLEGVRIGATHYPETAAGMAASGRFDLVCHGHDHQVRQERSGSCLLLNPGELMGRFGRSTWAWVDLSGLAAVTREVPAPV